jgi:hypothetical protein
MLRPQARCALLALRPALSLAAQRPFHLLAARAPAPAPARRLSTPARPAAAAAAAAAPAAAAASAATEAPLTWRSFLSPSAVFVRVKALGPTAIGMYGALWVGPFLLTFAPISLGLLEVPDPLVTMDHWLPALGDGLRGTLGFVGVEMPKAGEPLPPYQRGIVWGFLVNDVIEIPRLLAVLTLTPRVRDFLFSKGATASEKSKTL